MTPKNGKPLLEYYLDLYEKTEGRKALINRNRKVWGFADMAQDLGVTEAKKLIEYFFESYSNGNHDVETLLMKYDTMYEEMLTSRADAVRRSKIARETAERVKRLNNE